MTETTSRKKRSLPSAGGLGLVAAAALSLAASAPPNCDAFVGSAAPAAVVARPAGPLSGPLRAGMFQILDAPQQQPGAQAAWRTVFGTSGERGEYMDGYSPQAMAGRCAEDYLWGGAEIFSPEEPDGVCFASERARMMAHLYDSEDLWDYVSMVAFAEHYVLAAADEVIAKPFDTFQRQQQSQPRERPIFGGVVLGDWEAHDESGIEQKLSVFREKGIDYVRLECNFGSADDIGGASQLANHPRFRERFRRLAEATNACQRLEMVPLVLLQVPWREPGGNSNDYFEQAVKSLAGALKVARVESKRLLLETRPPIGLSAREEKGLSGTARISLGLEAGQKLFEVIEKAFDGDKIAGFCVAGGSTKGELPTAMEDDTQNAVRQGMRHCALQQWGYEVCFWEMGAKLMLQPMVGRLWGKAHSGRDAARKLFCTNAKYLADEIKAGIDR